MVSGLHTAVRLPGCGIFGLRTCGLERQGASGTPIAMTFRRAGRRILRRYFLPATADADSDLQLSTDAEYSRELDLPQCPDNIRPRCLFCGPSLCRGHLFCCGGTKSVSSTMEAELWQANSLTAITFNLCRPEQI